MSDMVIYCDTCYKVFFRKPLHNDGIDEILILDDIKKVYREHRVSDPCRSVCANMLSQVEREPF